MTEDVHLSDHQKDLIIFSLEYLWASMVDNGRFVMEDGMYKFTVQEIEELIMLMDVGIDKKALVEYKLRIMKDEI